MEDGTVIELTPGTVFHIPPGHDAWTEGDEACVELDFGGLIGYAVAKSECSIPTDLSLLRASVHHSRSRERVAACGG